jgi:multicomponent Na+:H+ antiporter subunit F
MLNVVATIATVILMISAALCLYRLVIGPTLPDRMLGLDTVSAVLMGLVVLVALRYRLLAYYDVVLVLASLVFIGTVMVAKFLGAGTPVDRSDR